MSDDVFPEITVPEAGVDQALDAREMPAAAPAGKAERTAESKLAESGAADTRSAATAALLGGLLLCLLAIATVRLTQGSEQVACYLIAATGALSFLAGAHSAVQGSLPRVLERPLQSAAGFFGISSGQVFLLVFAFLFSLLARFAAGDALLARSAPIASASWLLALFCASTGALERGRPFAVNITRGDLIFTAVIFGAALLLRGLALDRIPYPMLSDEGAMGISAARFVEGEANNLFSVGWFEFPSLYYAVQSSGIALFGRTIAAVRITSVLAGALTVVAVYWLARVTFDVTMARLASLIVLASHFHMHFSRIGLNNIWDALWAALAAAGLWYGWERGRHLGFVAAGLSLGLGQYFYVSTRLLPLVFVVWAIAALIVQRERFRRRLPGLILCAYVALVTVLPIGLFYNSHRESFAARFNHVTALDEWMDNEMALTGGSEAAVLAHQFSLAAQGIVSEPLLLVYQAGVPVLLTAAAALFLLGIAWGLSHMDLRYLLLMLPIVGTLIVVTITQNAPSSQRYVMAMPFIVIFAALPVSLLTDSLRGLWPEHSRLALVPAILLLAWIMLSESRFYFDEVFETYVMGGPNAAMVTDLGLRLQAEEDPPDLVWYGWPVMGWRSHEGILYLAPRVEGFDAQVGEAYPQEWTRDGRTMFVFLPGRLAQLDRVRADYPGGVYEEHFFGDRQLLYVVYIVE